MKLLIPPPFQALFFSIIMWLISRQFLNANFSFYGINIFASIFLIIALMLLILSINKFRQVGTTISPLKPKKHHP